jgi:hypothetical protein
LNPASLGEKSAPHRCVCTAGCVLLFPMNSHDDGVLEVVEMGAKKKGLLKRMNTTYTKLMWRLRSGQLAPPPKDESGHFVWFEEDIERARLALAKDGRGRRKLAPEAVTAP